MKSDLIRLVVAGVEFIHTTPTSSVVHFLHSDHLGSTSLTTDNNGNVVARQLYDAWGNVRLRGDVKTDIGYTSQREDVGINAMFYRARYYSPSLGRFVSPDTIVPDGKNPQAWNRYAYGLNNPVKYTDPSGHMVINDDRGGCDTRCNQPPDKIPPIIQFTFETMVADAQSDTAEHIRSLNAQCTACAYKDRSLAWPGMLQGYTSALRNDGTARLLAKARWAAMVCENCDWDYKKPLQDMEAAAGRDKYYQRVGSSDYYFDTWTNIVYGYVGRSAGFSADELLDGAGAEQIGSDVRHGRPLNGTIGVSPLRGFDEPTDGPSIALGIHLWETYGLAVMPEQIMSAIANTPGLNRRSINAK